MHRQKVHDAVVDMTLVQEEEEVGAGHSTCGAGAIDTLQAFVADIHTCLL